MSLPRVGFIGCGHHATHNLYPALRFTDVELVAVADRYDANRERNRRVFGAARAYDDFEPLLREETLDAVLVCGPPELHEAAALAALRRGLHVFVEKPPCMTSAGAEALRDAARAAGRVLAVGFMKRFAQKYRAAREIAAGAAFGRRSSCLARYSHGMEASHGLAWLHALMTIHAIDLVRFMMRECGEVVDVAWRRAAFGSRVCTHASFAFADGALATLISDGTSPVVTERLELLGDQAMIVVDELASLTFTPRGSSVWAAPHSELRRPNFPLQTRENDSSEIQGYAGEIAAFVAAIQGRPAPDLATIDDARIALRIGELLAGDAPVGRASLTAD